MSDKFNVNCLNTAEFFNNGKHTKHNCGDYEKRCDMDVCKILLLGSIP